MPKRSNDFQRLITIVESQLAPRGAIVTASKELWHPKSETFREVDIVIETRVGPHPVVIGIECIDWKRKATQPWVERFRVLHLELGIDKTVLVARTGFTGPARRLAESYGMIPLTPEEAEGFEWQLALGVKVVQNLISAIKVDLVDSPDGLNCDVRSTSLHYPDGSAWGLIWDIVTTSLQQPDAVLQTAELVAEDPGRLITFEIGTGQGCYIVDPFGNRYEVRRMWVTFRQKVIDIAPFQHYQYGDLAEVAHARVPVSNRQVELTVVRGLAPSDDIFMPREAQSDPRLP